MAIFKEPWLSLSIICSDVQTAVDKLELDDTPAGSRFRFEPGKTYCNIAFLDAVRMLGYPAPSYWFDPVTGDETRPARGSEMLVNRMGPWMRTHGVARGWMLETRIGEALKLAHSGRLVGGLQENPNGHGHVVIVRPDGYVAQAGARNASKLALRVAFTAQRPVQFWVAPPRQR
jgi:hypothetical protein